MLLTIGLIGLFWIYPSAFAPLLSEQAILSTGFDRSQHWVGLLAAMRDPIDWSRPFAISTLEYPAGTTLFLVDALPVVALPVRVIVQLTGLSVDPVLPIALWASLCHALGPFALYRLARVIGAGHRPALVSGLLALTVVPFVQYLYSGWEALSGWSLLALLIAELVIIERRGDTRPALLRLAFLSLLLSWSSAYLGAMAIALSIGVGMRAILGRRVVSGLLLIAVSTAPSLAALFLGGAGDGLLVGVSAGQNGSLHGLIDFSLAGVKSDLTPYRGWGLLVAILLIVSITSIARSLGALGLMAIAMAVFSFGSTEHGGLLPAPLYSAFPPAGLLYEIYRFLTPLVLLSLAIAPIVLLSIVRRIDPSRRWFGPLLLVGLLLVSFAEVDAFGGLRGVVSRSSEPMPAARALSALVEQHQVVRIEPPMRCLGFYQIEERELDSHTVGMGLTVQLAYYAVRADLPIESYYLSRLPARLSCDSSTPLADATLVVRYGGDSTASSGAFGALGPAYRCVELTSAELLLEAWATDELQLRFCSEDTKALSRFALVFDKPVVAPQ